MSYASCVVFTVDIFGPLRVLVTTYVLITPRIHVYTLLTCTMFYSLGCKVNIFLVTVVSRFYVTRFHEFVQLLFGLKWQGVTVKRVNAVVLLS